ncbi:MAG: Trehalose-6-phosphate synthase [Phycisphaerae bacterium]|nr:Trehalose-6-phosphate synthase [Phycisphaerae bacterium]
MPTMPLNSDQLPAGRILVVSNRGPHDFVWRDEQWTATRAAGGLVSMIEPLARRPDVSWYCCVSEPPDAVEARDSIYTLATDQIDPELGVVPIPVPARVYRQYYGVISNEVLWMLQHHLVGQFGYQYLDERRHRAWFEGYLEANRRIADAIIVAHEPIRALLIQDYHLYPLPQLLRPHFPRTPILHFTHIPFPDPPTLRLIPRAWRQVILEGLLGADVVGMQTQSDVRNFRLACEEFLGAVVDGARSNVLAADGRWVRVRVFPASTDPAALQEIMQSAEVREAAARLRRDASVMTVVRVDRVDPSKNQIIGFMAYERLLELRPELVGRVQFRAFLIPSRTDMSVYREYHEAVNGVIDRINQRFGRNDTTGRAAVEVFYTNNREQALAALADCDILLANSREDGMNLVVKEWAVVSQRPGVVIVSETAGVAAETGNDALLISPLDVEGTARAMAAALDMPNAERAVRLQRIRSGVLDWTAERWLSAQLTELLPGENMVSSGTDRRRIAIE